MKKMYYSIADDRSIELARYDGRERFIITVSSKATPADVQSTLTAETGGYTLGPGDDSTQDLCEFVRNNWDMLDEMSAYETSAYIEELAEGWGLIPDEIDYLI